VLLVEQDDTKIVPLVNHVNYGDKATFTCHSRQKTIWLFGSSLDRVEVVHSSSHALELDNVKAVNQGRYYCYGDDDKSRSKFLAGSNLRVYCKSMFDVPI